MPIKGVTKDEEKIIVSSLEPYKNKYEFYFYGSRVKGNFRPLSDLDILIKGSVDANDVVIIKDFFAISSLSYIVNFVDFNNIDTTFYQHIEKDLVKLNF